jgi:transmembrane sensor
MNVLGRPDVEPEVARRAVHWWVEMNSGEPRDSHRRAFERWLAAHPDHAAAWRHIESVSGRIHGVAEHAGAARAALAQQPPRKRRSTLKALALLMFAGTGAWVAEERTPWRAWTADYRTAVGERRTVTLADATVLTLDTNSAVDVRFTATERRVRLVRGALMATTGHLAMEARRFFVDTAQGSLEALGTRFAVRQDDADTRLDVFEGAVRIEPADAPGNALVLHAGERARFDRREVSSREPLVADTAAWTDGLIVATSMRLADFLAELSRYRPGVLRCDPAIADLRLSGTYPLDNTDRVLDALERALPIRVAYATRYWATVHPTRG